MSLKHSRKLKHEYRARVSYGSTYPLPTSKMSWNKHKWDDKKNKNTYTEKFTQHSKTHMCSEERNETKHNISC